MVNLWQVLSSAFSATALFALGLRMVGKMQSLRGHQLVVPGILIAVKWYLPNENVALPITESLTYNGAFF